MEKKNQRKVVRSWEKSEIKRLIQIYEDKPDLWDPSRENYQNR